MTAGESGPVVALSGEASLHTAADLGELLHTQVEAETTTHVTLDVSELTFIDSMAVRLLVMAGKVLRERGGSLVVMLPQDGVARVLEIMGVDQTIAVQGGAWRGRGGSTTDR